jgi:hypothetical protein
MKIFSVGILLAITVSLARAFPSQPGACITGGPSPESGPLHRGKGFGSINDGGIVFTIGGKEADEDGVFSLVDNTDYEVILKGPPSFLGFLVVVSTTTNFIDSSEVLTFDEEDFPLATSRDGICPSTVGFISHSNVARVPITEISSTLRFDNDAIGDPIPLDVNVVVNLASWYHSSFSIKVTAKPVSFVCFSGAASVDVENKGIIHMMNLEVGDRVKVAENKYEPVYSFGHYDKQGFGDFLVINNELEISSDHLIATKGNGYVPASSLKVGDFIMSGSDGASTKVKSIIERTSQGIFAPFTTSGTIVVSGILASSFVSLQSDTGYLTIGGVNTGLSHHWMAHKFELPHRLVCHYFGSCQNPTYTDTGISHWVEMPRRFFLWLLDQNMTIVVLSLIPFVSALAIFSLMEALLTAPVGLLAVVLVAALYHHHMFKIKKIKEM